MDWFFDGLGTLLIGLLVGGSVGGAAGWRLGVQSVRQKQRAGDHAKQTQVGGNQSIEKRR
jgi:hypothetical protein